MFNLGKLVLDFPEEWETIRRRALRVGRTDDSETRLYIPGIGRVSSPGNVSTNELFELLLEKFLKMPRHNIDKTHRLTKELYEQEVSILIGSWSDEALMIVSQMGSGDESRIFEYLNNLRKSNLAFYL